jgi:predicted O-methyltransferase YrrM
MKQIEEVIGSSLQVLCRMLIKERPQWITGSQSYSDTCFLFETALVAGASTTIEIGTASGFSTAVLCHALNFASQAGLISPDFQIVPYDVSPYFYADRSKRVGEAAREQLPPELMEHITFRHPAFTRDVKQHHGDGEIKLLFIDASHKHPWPALNFLATLGCLSPGALVLLHDINLPLINPAFQGWGAKFLFDDLDVQKDVPMDNRMPHIGSIKVPENKELLRVQLLDIIYRHPWEAEVPEDYLDSLGIRSNESP